MESEETGGVAPLKNFSEEQVHPLLDNSGNTPGFYVHPWARSPQLVMMCVMCFYLFLVQHVELVSVSDAERAAPAGGVVGVAIQRSVRPGTRRHTPSICRKKGMEKGLKPSLHY